jgi:hypothetical protein
MEQLMHANIHSKRHTTTNDILTLHQSNVKRPNESTLETQSDDEQRTEKRLDSRKSPTKKQLSSHERTVQLTNTNQQVDTSDMDEDDNISSKTND